MSQNAGIVKYKERCQRTAIYLMLIAQLMFTPLHYDYKTATENHNHNSLAVLNA